MWLFEFESYFYSLVPFYLYCSGVHFLGTIVCLNRGRKSYTSLITMTGNSKLLRNVHDFSEQDISFIFVSG